ncbi:MAG: zinc ribbon domain-containing protein [Defluviitaleaceae bacterium]|nr:zinc ribbon domain-containing protein [Defluviitaleaceae bacterium]MCL2240416.1 zinc ribbon domain-containing protein [Defluviitaleaceae bacterium]
MFCHKCGNKMQDDSLFCSKCGEKINDENITQESVPNIKKKISPYALSSLAVVIVIVIIIFAFTGSDEDISSGNILATEALYMNQSPNYIQQQADANNSPPSPTPSATTGTQETLDSVYQSTPLTMEEAYSVLREWMEETTNDAWLWFEITDAMPGGFLAWLLQLGVEDAFARIFVSDNRSIYYVGDDTQIPLDEWLAIIEEEWQSYWDDYEWDDNNWEQATAFNRIPYFTGLTRDNMLRFARDNLHRKVYFEQFVVQHIFAPGYYVVHRGGFNENRNYRLIVDGRFRMHGSTANALVGDIISFYGVFQYVDTLTMTDGRTIQVPLIFADLIIFNQFRPTPEEFAPAFVDTLGHNPDSFGHGQHLGGASIRIPINTAPNGDIFIRSLYHAFGVDLRLRAPNIDGFQTTIAWEFAPGFSVNSNDGPLWLTGTITSISANMFDPTMITVTILVEDISS